MPDIVIHCNVLASSEYTRLARLLFQSDQTLTFSCCKEPRPSPAPLGRSLAASISIPIPFLPAGVFQGEKKVDGNTIWAHILQMMYLAHA
jgi:hypothetical protein